MAPKEKAEQLVNKFYPRATSYSSDRKNQKDNAKQCALIAVDEIINSVVITNLTIAQNQFDYWVEVKQEIEKL